MKVIGLWVGLLVLGTCHAGTPCDNLYSGAVGTMPVNVDKEVFKKMFTFMCGAYQDKLIAHPELNFTKTNVNNLVGGSDPLGMASGTYKLWLHAQMLHYKETDIEFMWLDAPWIQSLSDYLEPFPMTTEQRAEFLPKTVQTNR